MCRFFRFGNRKSSFERRCDAIWAEAVYLIIISKWIASQRVATCERARILAIGPYIFFALCVKQSLQHRCPLIKFHTWNWRLNVWFLFFLTLSSMKITVSCWCTHVLYHRISVTRAATIVYIYIHIFGFDGFYASIEMFEHFDNSDNGLKKKKKDRSMEKHLCYKMRLANQLRALVFHIGSNLNFGTTKKTNENLFATNSMLCLFFIINFGRSDRTEYKVATMRIYWIISFVLHGTLRTELNIVSFVI